MKFLRILWEHRTKVLGYSQVVLGSLAVADPAMLNAVLGPDGARWIVLTSGVLTAIVGHYNTHRAKLAVPA